MTKKKASDSLHCPVAKAKWDAARAAERITYAESTRISWRDGGIYTGTELQHRSMRNQQPSVVMGQRIVHNA